MKPLKTLIWLALWLYFLIDITPLAISRLEAYAVETANRSVLERLASLVSGKL